MNTQQILSLASEYLRELPGHRFEVLEIAKPASIQAGINLSRIVSKLSPLVGNLIEFNTCEFLNLQEGFHEHGSWFRQDPGFPDTVFRGSISPMPGFEIKAWFPLATEITARFKDSQLHFADDQTYVALLAWLPEFLIFGKPRIVDIVIVSGRSVAQARDSHYHNPPDYIVLEPEDTTDRTANLQQTNTNGYKFQGSPAELQAAQRLLSSFGINSGSYRPDRDYQENMRQLLGAYSYRLDTNYAKMDRIVHPGIEAFKRRVYNTSISGLTIGEWNRLLSKGSDELIAGELRTRLDIEDAGAGIID
jgi:hypothetical protein